MESDADIEALIMALMLHESDVAHDLLGRLAEEMIRLNKEKRALRTEFTDWLVAALRVQPDKDGRAGLDALVGKVRLADFAGDYQKGEAALTDAGLRDIIAKNRARLGLRVGAEVQDEISRRYAAALDTVLPLKERLARTDRLIDQIVYRLYGLTDDEIAVVEGRS